mmetsp:Transcript_32710/g.59876  ORF Transcript_32710/g.59876 Transcript_32710/m.59876 type:complete len:808 (+) Transcript_32710:95-2518(+)
MGRLNETIMFLLSVNMMFLGVWSEETEDAETSETDADTDESGSDEEEELTPELKIAVATSIFAIITILLVISSFFEWLKDKIEESTPEKMKDVMEVLFSEMTVLGFLSLITFCISKMGYLGTISQNVYSELGEEGDDYLEELLESVHYDLFLVMVLFILQTLAMIKMGAQSEKDWVELEKNVANPEFLTNARKELRDQLEGGGPKFWQMGKRRRVQELYHIFEFASLKKEFLHGRQTAPPFEPLPEKEHLAKDFSYGDYLVVRLSKFMAEVIDMNVKTWLLLEVLLLFFYLIMYLSDLDSQVLMWAWVALGYLVTGWMMSLMKGAKWMREMHINPADMPSAYNNYHSEAARFHRRDSIMSDDSVIPPKPPAAAAKTSPFGARAFVDKLFSKKPTGGGAIRDQRGGAGYSAINEGGRGLHKDKLGDAHPWREETKKGILDPVSKMMGHGVMEPHEVDYDNLPGWCHLVPVQEKRTGIRALLLGKAPNRQQMLYAFQCNGFYAQLLSVRILLFTHAVYFSVLILEFYDDAYLHYGATGFCVFFAVALLPSLMFFGVALPTIKDVVHMGNIGCLRKKKDIAYVIREQKTKKALKTLILLKNLQMKLSADTSAGGGEGSDIDESSHSMSSERKSQLLHQMSRKDVTKEERMRNIRDEMGHDAFDEIGRMFDLYDSDGGGEIDSGELADLMRSLGKVMDEVEAKDMMKHLDIDGDGTVSKEEFMLWHMEQIRNPPEMEPEEVARQIFKIFDDDGSDSITIQEFKDVLDRFKVDLSIDEITDLARELDVDGDGTISEEEFAALLMKHADEVIG